MSLKFFVTNRKDETLHFVFNARTTPLYQTPWEMAVDIMRQYDDNVDVPTDRSVVSSVYSVSYRRGVIHIDATRYAGKARRVISLVAIQSKA